MTDRRLSRIAPDRLGETAHALAAAGLPTADIDPDRMAFYELADGEGALGWAALEQSGEDALLRSVLTIAGRRSAGVGTELVTRVGARAAEEGVRRLWLLTETAAPFFAKLGFAEVPRTSAPQGMQETSEFRNICPESATCMMLELEGR